MDIRIIKWNFIPALSLCAVVFFTGHDRLAMAANDSDSASTTTTANSGTSTATESLSDDDWRNLSQEDRHERMRRWMVSRYEPSGQMSPDKLAQYVDKFAEFNVYDPRYYLYKINATLVPGTTSTVKLTGDVCPANYRKGIAEDLESLGFTIAENEIRTLPVPGAGFGISTTNAATLRKEPRRRAEQLDSVALGGTIRFLRDAEESDLDPTAKVRARHAPGADAMQEDNVNDWALAQNMVGYLGFVRKADFKKTDTYNLPDGILKHPVSLNETTTLPAGIYVYGSPDSGWQLASGEKMPDDSQITDMRPAVTPEEILDLTKPFMKTGYVWGGVTDQGIDCSGLSQFFLRTNGVSVPRDAVQQATGGLIVAWGPEDVKKNAKPGDLLFFSKENGRISHVAISLGGKRIVHSAGPGVHLTNLDDPKNEGMDKEYGDSILFARRMVSGR